MEQEWSDRIDGLLSEFLLQDDLQQLTLDTGMLLQCPLLVLDDTFHVRAHFLPPSFSDEVFRNAVRCGEITYEAGAVISKSPALSGGTADYIKLVDSVYPRRFAPLISAGGRLGDLFSLPALYRTAHEALELMRDERFHSGNICTVAQLRTPLLLKNLELRGDLISRDVQRLAAHDRERNTQYCETLYHYLTCNRSLKKTCDALFTHRNTVLYRIRRMQEEFRLPLDEPSAHADLLLSVSLVLFQQKGPDFFLCTAGEAGRPEQEK